MSRVAFDFGVIQIYWYSIMVFLGVFAAITVITREVKRIGLNEDETVDMIMNTLIIGIIGARLYFVLFNIAYYKNNLLEIFEIWNGGLAIHGGILFGVLYVLYYSKKHRLEFLKQLDYLSLGLILGQAIGRWGNFFNQEAYGATTTLETLSKKGLPNFIIEGMKIDGLYHQPTFLYESIWNLIGFIIMYIMRKYKYLKTGSLLAFYLLWYSSGRLVIEGMRTDSLMIGPLRIAQLISVVGIILGIIIIIKNGRLAKLDNLYNASKIKETNVKAQTNIVDDPNKHKVKIFDQENQVPDINNDPYGDNKNN